MQFSLKINSFSRFSRRMNTSLKVSEMKEQHQPKYKNCSERNTLLVWCPIQKSLLCLLGHLTKTEGEQGSQVKGQKQYWKVSQGPYLPNWCCGTSGLGGFWTLCHFSTFTSVSTPQKLLYLKVYGAINLCLKLFMQSQNIILQKRAKKKYIFFSIKSDKMSMLL